MRVAWLLVLAWGTAAAETPRDRAWQLTQGAETAARADDCARVAVLAGVVRAIDADFYMTVLARDVAVARCLELVPPVKPPPPPPPPPEVEPARPAVAVAEAGATSEPAESPPLCFEGHPRPACAATFVLEAAYRHGNIDTASLNLGVIVNVDGPNALGVTAGFLDYKRPDDSGGWTSSKFLELRYRRWITSDAALDFGVAAIDATEMGDRLGSMAIASIEIRDLFALTASAELVPLGSTQAIGANVGVRVGAKPLGYAVYGLALIVGALADAHKH